jgi:tRNA (guanine37-N1)-methyltransferase
VWRGREVPAVLRSGNHAAIARWRRDRAVERTAARRPDLLAALPADALDGVDRAVVEGLATPRG